MGTMIIASVVRIKNILNYIDNYIADKPLALT